MAKREAQVMSLFGHQSTSPEFLRATVASYPPKWFERNALSIGYGHGQSLPRALIDGRADACQ
jgi:hypothetical protein